MSRRASTDVAWRAALGLNFDVWVPDEKTVRDSERLVRGRHSACDVPRYMLLHGYVVRLCLNNGVVRADAPWVMDSTPPWCFGAVPDPAGLLGDVLRILATGWARATLDAVAAHWDAPDRMAPSTKGAFAIISVGTETAGRATTTDATPFGTSHLWLLERALIRVGAALVPHGERRGVSLH